MKILQNIKSGLVIGLSAIIVIVGGLSAYAAISSTRTDTPNLEATAGAVLTAENWNKLVGNVEYLSGQIEMLKGLYNDNHNGTGEGCEDPMIQLACALETNDCPEACALPLPSLSISMLDTGHFMANSDGSNPAVSMSITFTPNKTTSGMVSLSNNYFVLSGTLTCETGWTGTVSDNRYVSERCENSEICGNIGLGGGGGGRGGGGDYYSFTSLKEITIGYNFVPYTWQTTGTQHCSGLYLTDEYHVDVRIVDGNGYSLSQTKHITFPYKVIPYNGGNAGGGGGGGGGEG